MVDPGRKTLIYPGGEQRIFRQTAEDTAGELLEMEVTYLPHSHPPPLHFHPEQVEHFEVLTGAFRVEVDGVEKTYEAGDRFSVPAGAAHRMYNISDRQGRLIWQVRPALRTQAFFERMWRAQTEHGRPGLLELAVILPHYHREFQPVSPPRILQRVLFGLLAPVGRAFGIRP